MANLGLLGAVAGLGQGLQTFGADLVRRRERALEWAQREAEAQRRRLDRKEEIDTQFQQQKEITTMREDAANARTQADIEARAAERKADREFKVEDREDEQRFQTERDAAKAKDEAALAKLRATLERSNSAADARLKDDLAKDDVQGIKYGERYSVNPKSGRPYSDPNSPYTELIIVKKNGDIVHTGKLILAPQNRAGQDGEDSPY